MDSGIAHSCAVVSGGAVSCWGKNTAGQLGNSMTTDQSSPVAAFSFLGVQSVSCGFGHTCVVMAGSSIRCWGENTFGQLGDNSKIGQPTASVVVSGITNASAVLASTAFTCAFLLDKKVMC
ncbi:MAG: hypothetical protein GY822_19405 [Deltaproteobacteria bacterium]|nr:hypothetical protein [Deltaproteobacteria bacterium]